MPEGLWLLRKNPIPKYALDGRGASQAVRDYVERRLDYVPVCSNDGGDDADSPAHVNSYGSIFVFAGSPRRLSFTIGRWALELAFWLSQESGVRRTGTMTKRLRVELMTSHIAGRTRNGEQDE